MIIQFPGALKPRERGFYWSLERRGFLRGGLIAVFGGNEGNDVLLGAGLWC